MGKFIYSHLTAKVVVYILYSNIFSSVTCFHLGISSCFAVKQHIFIFHHIFSSLNLTVCRSPPGNMSEV